MRRFIAATAVLLGAALAIAVPGQAFAAELDNPTLTLSPDSARPNTLVTAVPNCQGGEVASLSAQANVVEFTDLKGNVKDNATAGRYTVTLTCKPKNVGDTYDNEAATATATAVLTVRGDRFDSCDDYNRNGIRDIRRGDQRYQDALDRDRNGIACDRGDVVVSDDGNCVTFREQRTTFGTTLNDRIRRYNQLIADAKRDNSENGSSISTTEQNRINDALADIDRRRGDYDRVSGELKTICKDESPSPVVIVNQEPAPEGSKPSSSGSVASNAPSVGQAETGEPNDDSTVAVDTAVIANSVVIAGVAVRVFVDLGGVG